jgi:lysyl-tRNA synthetase, class I
MSRRFSPSSQELYWAREVAREMIRLEPKKQSFVVAGGISPSGTVHYGNFRDIFTSFAVAEMLRSEGKEATMLFSWDDFDRLRKVPSNVPSSFQEHIGKPLSKIPSPDGSALSYAEFFETEFEKTLCRLALPIEYRYQTKEYESGRYDDAIIECIKARHEVAEVLLSFMSDKGKAEKKIDEVAFRETYFPLSVYSEFNGTDITEVLDFDGDATITYRCKKSDQVSSFNLREKRIAKLSWKIDWPMRWKAEEVAFEPAGFDHATPGGSWDVSAVISEKIFHRSPPLFTRYGFVGLRGQGVKMSGSKGNAISPGDLLDVYEIPVLLWLYTRKDPAVEFSLSFDSEIYRQYDEFDKEVESYLAGTLSESKVDSLRLSFFSQPFPSETEIPLRQVVGLGQTTQWDEEKVRTILSFTEESFDNKSISTRLKKGKKWLERYNPQEAIVVCNAPHAEAFRALSEGARQRIIQLRQELPEDFTLGNLEELVYRIPKDPSLSAEDNKPRQRAFFKDVYRLLIDKETGPRLSTFLWSLGKEKTEYLLTFS